MLPLALAAGAFALRRRRKRRKQGRPFGPKVLFGRRPRVSSPEMEAIAAAMEPGDVKAPQKSTGYILITDNENEENTYLGRILDFDVNRGFMGRGKTEKVLLDGHVIYETQLRNATRTKLIEDFADNFDIQQLAASQVANILADEEDDPQMFGATQELDDAIEDQLDELRQELEAEYLERFEEDYQARLKQEYPGMFSSDFQKHYTDMVQDELDDVVDDHEDLYTEYIVTDKHIRYKR